MLFLKNNKQDVEGDTTIWDDVPDIVDPERQSRASDTLHTNPGLMERNTDGKKGKTQG